MMRFTLFALLTLFTLTDLQAQEKAVTESGDTLIIYSDGTWDYYENYLKNPGGNGNLPFETFRTEDIPVNENTFAKNAKATSSLKGGDGMYQVYYDPMKWKRIPAGTFNEEAENALQLIGNDAYSMLIFERIEIPMETLLGIAVENARNVAPQAKISFKEFRRVNGKKVLCGKITASVSGIDFIYYSYYYSDSRGTLQFTTFTGSNLLPEVEKDLENLLNGLVILE